jgi:hypothetical protein
LAVSLRHDPCIQMREDLTMKTEKLPISRTPRKSQFFQTLREAVPPALRLLARPGTLAQVPRLFREGIAPVRRMFTQAHNNREIARLLHEQAPIGFVCSFARSGNTWMRHLLCDVLLQNQGIETTTESAIGMGRIIPDYYADLIARRETSVQAPCCLIKIHGIIPLLQQDIGGDPAVRKCKYLYLYRTAEDTLVSLFHLYRREKYVRSHSGGDIDLFCLEFLSGWVENVNSYLAEFDEGVDIHLVSYQQLLREPVAVLSEALGWLGVPYTDAKATRADANMKFSKLQAREAKTLGGKVPFFRRGCDGSGKLELKPETLKIIRESTGELMAKADQHLARQRGQQDELQARVLKCVSA